MQVAQLFLVHVVEGKEDTEDEGHYMLNLVEATQAPWEVTNSIIFS